jgi:hypothetical protein
LWCALALAWVALAFVPTIPWHKGETFMGYLPLFVVYLGGVGSTGVAVVWGCAHLTGAALLAFVLTGLHRRGRGASATGGSPGMDVLVELLALTMTLACGVGAATLLIEINIQAHSHSPGSLGVPLVIAVWGCACGLGLLTRRTWAGRWLLLWALGSVLALGIAWARGAFS